MNANHQNKRSSLTKLTEKLKRAPKTSSNQREHLINYMTSHDHLATRGKLGVRGNDTYKAMWTSLAATLNNMGPTRTWQQWVAAWQAIVRRSRDNNGKVKLSMRTTGNPAPAEPLTAEEEKILSTLGKETSSGMEDDIPSLGFDEIVDDLEAKGTNETVSTAASLETPAAIKSAPEILICPEHREVIEREDAIGMESQESSTIIDVFDKSTTSIEGDIKSTTAPTNSQSRPKTIVRRRVRAAEYVQASNNRQRVMEELSTASIEHVRQLKRMNDNFELWAPRLIRCFERIEERLPSPEKKNELTITENDSANAI